MKNMRKLIPAIAMLLVSAVMMSTASFAWFTSSAAATANGFEVKAVADGGLAIGAWTNASTAPKDVAFYSSVKPGYTDGTTATKDADGNYEVTLKPATHTGSAWMQNVGTQVDKHTASTTYSASTNYIHTKYDVKALAPDKSYTLKVAGISVGGSDSTTEKLNEALRVAINVGGNWFYFAPTRIASDRTTGTNPVDPFKFYNGSAVASYTLVDTTSAATNTAALNKGELATSDMADVAIHDNLQDDALTIEVYIYYEGEDLNCISAYALATNSLVPVTINFTATENVSSGS